MAIHGWFSRVHDDLDRADLEARALDQLAEGHVGLHVRRTAPESTASRSARRTPRAGACRRAGARRRRTCCPSGRAGAKNGSPWMWSQWVWLTSRCAVPRAFAELALHHLLAELSEAGAGVDDDARSADLGGAHLDARGVAAVAVGLGTRARDRSRARPKSGPSSAAPHEMRRRTLPHARTTGTAAHRTDRNMESEKHPVFTDFYLL